MARAALFALFAVSLLLPAAVAGENETAQALEKLGGSIMRALREPGKPVVSAHLHGPRFTDEALKGLNKLKRLRRLGIVSTKVTDAGLKELKGLKELQHLNLAFTPVTDTGLKELKGLAKLQELLLEGTHVTGEALAQLRGLKLQ